MKIKDFYEISKPLILDGGFATELETTAGADIASTCSYQIPVDTFIKEGFTYQESIELIQKSVHIAVEARDVFWKEYQTNKDHECQTKNDNYEIYQTKNDNDQEYQTKNEAKNGKDQERMKPMIALSLGPFGGPLGDYSEYTGNYGNEVNLETLKDFHKKNLNLFKPLLSLIDFIAFETVPSYLEAESICSLLKEENLDIPCWISFSCKNEEQISHGELIIDCVQLCSKIESIVSIGINCVKPRYIEKLVKIIREGLDQNGYEKKYVICYPNGEDFDYYNDKNSHEILSKEFEDYTKIWVELAKSKVIVGGCCKSTPDHIRCIRNVLKN
ncbi:homocysteine S-methyltransferase 3 [Rhizophagus clarus]|uniref:Homocysteine S-methyltransferase 3 n=1 Tax=Rhizophagus clarus TaxID=94130 RepID=A0A8H3KSG3_9GLOM|nr:homocysteine S-methyltransferase 3 [Rhizophagus clarus]